MHGSGDSLRSYLYVTDVAEAFDIILHKGEIGEVYNIGTQKERSVLAVAKDVCRHFNVDPLTAVEYVPNRLFNDRRYFIDDSKLTSLGWKPKVSWDDGLKLTIQWYQQHVFEGQYWPDYERALAAHPLSMHSVAMTDQF